MGHSRWHPTQRYIMGRAYCTTVHSSAVAVIMHGHSDFAIWKSNMTVLDNDGNYGEHTATGTP